MSLLRFCSPDSSPLGRRLAQLAFASRRVGEYASAVRAVPRSRVSGNPGVDAALDRTATTPWWTATARRPQCERAEGTTR